MVITPPAISYTLAFTAAFAAASVVLEFAVARTVNEVVVSLPTAPVVPEITPADDIANPAPDKFEVVSV